MTPFQRDLALAISFLPACSFVFLPFYNLFTKTNLPSVEAKRDAETVNLDAISIYLLGFCDPQLSSDSDVLELAWKTLEEAVQDENVSSTNYIIPLNGMYYLVHVDLSNPKDRQVLRDLFFPDATGLRTEDYSLTPVNQIAAAASTLAIFSTPQLSLRTIEPTEDLRIDLSNPENRQVLRDLFLPDATGLRTEDYSLTPVSQIAAAASTLAIFSTPQLSLRTIELTEDLRLTQLALAALKQMPQEGEGSQAGGDVIPWHLFQSKPVSLAPKEWEILLLLLERAKTSKMPGTR